MNKPLSDDWRRHGQEKYLKGAKLITRDYHPYKPDWEHDHCAFCGETFSTHEGDIKQGYSTMNSYHWICNQCFDDFKDEFEWQVENLNKTFQL